MQVKLRDFQLIDFELESGWIIENAVVSMNGVLWGELLRGAEGLEIEDFDLPVASVLIAAARWSGREWVRRWE